MLIIRLLWFVGLVLLQSLVLNNINIYGLFAPAIYIYLILAMNTSVGRKSLLLWAFFLGLAIDMMCNTPGLNAAATVMIAFFRKAFVRSQTLREISENFNPGCKSMGFAPYMRYVFFMSLLHGLTIGLLDAFSIANIGLVLLRAVSNALVTTLCIICIDRMRRS